MREINRGLYGRKTSVLVCVQLWEFDSQSLSVHGFVPFSLQCSSGLRVVNRVGVGGEFLIRDRSRREVHSVGIGNEVRVSVDDDPGPAVLGLRTS